MRVRLLATAWLATLAGCSTEMLAPPRTPAPQSPGMPPHVRLSQQDVFFYQRTFRLEFEYSSWNGSCGYEILGNYRSRQVPRPEWAISLDEVLDNDTPIVRVGAVAFRVVTREGKAFQERRPPITALAFTLKDGAGEVLTARIGGRPNEDNSINATLDTAPARKLFEAFYAAQAIEISLTYQDGATDVLDVRSWKSWPPVEGGDYFRECLDNLHPIPAGTRYFIYRLGLAPGGNIVWSSPLDSVCAEPTGKRGSCIPP